MMESSASIKLAKPKVRRAIPRLLGLSFFVCVIVPTLIFFGYATFVRSPLYMSEVRLTVTTADEAGTSLSGMNSLVKRLGNGTSLGNEGDIYGIRDYILSRDIIQDIGGKDRLAKVFGQDTTDAFSRIETSASIEDYWDFWKGKVTAYADPTSNILIVRVHTFDPADSKALIEEIVASSERLINDMSVRRRERALEMAGLQVEKSSQAVAEARANLLNLQQETGVIDPLETASQLAKLIGELKLERIGLRIDLATRDSSGLRNDTRKQELEYKIGAITDQIDELERQMVSAGRENSMISVLRRYELLLLNEEFQTQIYTINRNAYEKAKRALEEQQKYLSVIVRAVVPEKPVNAQPMGDIFLVFCAALVLWGIAALLVAAVRDT